MSRRRKRRSGRPARRSALETTADLADPDWVDVCGRRMFVVGWTSGGAPYGVFEDEMFEGEMDATMSDLDGDGDGDAGDLPF